MCCFAWCLLCQSCSKTSDVGRVSACARYDMPGMTPCILSMLQTPYVRCCTVCRRTEACSTMQVPLRGAGELAHLPDPAGVPEAGPRMAALLPTRATAASRKSSTAWARAGCSSSVLVPARGARPSAAAAAAMTGSRSRGGQAAVGAPPGGVPRSAHPPPNRCSARHPADGRLHDDRVRQITCTCACNVMQKGRATCGIIDRRCVAACVQMPGGNAEEPLTLLSSDEDVPAQPVGRQNVNGAGALVADVAYGACAICIAAGCQSGVK